MYTHTQRGEYEREEEVNKQIDQLLQHQKVIAEKSKLAMKYVKQVLHLAKSNCTPEMRYERLRIYHKWLGFLLRYHNILYSTNEIIRLFSCEQIEGLDIVGFHRELGQLYISTMGNNVTDSMAAIRLKTDISQCFGLIVQAGVSIELIDGDTTNMNEEIIIELLGYLKRS